MTTSTSMVPHASEPDPTVSASQAYTCPPSENQNLGPLAASVLPRVFKLYDLSARAPEYEVYRQDATFEDPLMKANGVKQIKSAFYSMVKIFEEARIKEYSVVETQTQEGNGKVIVDNVQHYKVFGREMDIVSRITLTVEDGVITKHQDLWDKKPLPTGMYGALAQGTRRASMLLTHAIMGFGKDLKPPQGP